MKNSRLMISITIICNIYGLHLIDNILHWRFLLLSAMNKTNTEARLFTANNSEIVCARLPSAEQSLVQVDVVLNHLNISASTMRLTFNYPHSRRNDARRKLTVYVVSSCCVRIYNSCANGFLDSNSTRPSAGVFNSHTACAAALPEVLNYFRRGPTVVV